MRLRPFDEEDRDHRRGWEEDRFLGRSPRALVVEVDGDAVGRVDWRTDERTGPEQRALEAAGLRREGLLRGHHVRAGAWRDSYVYGIVRDDRSEWV